MKPDDAAAFREFVQSRWGRLVRIAYLMTGDHGEAEDLTQTALARVGASWTRVRAVEQPDSYVRRVLVNCNINRYRRLRPVALFGMRTPDVPGPDPTHQIDERDALMRALADLPPRQRAVVVLRFWDDMSEADVAGVLGCSVGTVKSQTSKGLAKLRRDPALAAAARNAQAPLEGTSHERT
ncbi:SigE family RNA polymerase sigma factor [Embleya scabrispora]|uniref:SigE family RNA polymerase sigma factor n=1 Tax=Embleya scabrispora TaxID=159449 RepID=UPI00068A410D|nr:SigE family RNA polymerase sigma factor [Embleya scabrispora]MYS86892.1 SigE family RNA polymerase sigma factor [Streptomyces sp. SID5474]